MKAKKVLIILGILAVLSAVLLGFVGRKDIMAALSEPVDIYENLPEDFHEVFGVETELYAVYDMFYEKESKWSRLTGRENEKTKDYYYVVPVVGADEETYYVALQADGTDAAEEYDRLLQYTWAYLNGQVSYLGQETVEFQGALFPLSENVYERFKSWFTNQVFFQSESDLEKYVLPLMLKPINYELTRAVLPGMAVSLGVGILMLLAGLRYPVKKKDKAVVKENAVIKENIAVKQSVIRKEEETFAATERKMFPINGISYPVSMFENVNKNILAGSKIVAIKEVMDITGVGLAEAKRIVENWVQYWGY